MTTTALTRRQFIAASGLAVLARRDQPAVAENSALAYRVLVRAGAVTARSFENRLTGEVIPLPPEEFRLEFEDGRTLASGELEARVTVATDGTLELTFSRAADVEIRVRYQVEPTWHYLRKQISLRATGPAPARLLGAELENWRSVPRPWNSMRADHFTYGSHPIHSRDLWAGVEFVAAFNEYNADGFTLRSRPGGVRAGREWFDLRSTVVGVARTGAVREAFLRYIDDIRIAPARMVACYNSWWTLPKVVRQADNLALIKQLKADLYDRHGVFFDIITTDMGWSNPRSIWEIDPSILPNGFADIRGIVEPAGGRLGLWMSPSEVYPPVCDYEWAAKEGYVVLRRDPAVPERLQPRFNKPGISLADPRYREETKRQLAKLIRENGLAHIKYDGFWAIEHRAHHDLLPGENSVEPLAAHSLELLQVSKAANPDLVTEPTYLNSLVSYISPWQLKYSDTVWANGEDCVVGIGPAPDHRDSHTNAREYMVFQSLEQVWLPQNAVHYFDIVHVDSREGFPNHAAIAVGRGRFFLSTYINPKLMSDEDWRIYAGLLRWARQNTELLRHTVVVPSRVEHGEPYMYGHWLADRGIVVVRNPSNETREVAIDLARTGAPASVADAVCYTQYPHRRGIAADVTGRSTLPVNLAPWEVLFVEIVPRSQLKETVVIGGRWYRAAGRTIALAPDAGVKSVRIIEPGQRDRRVRVDQSLRPAPSGELVACTATAQPENERLTAKPRTVALFPFRYPADFSSETIASLRATGWKEISWKKVPGVNFALECAVTIPGGAAGQVLLLVEFPGREHRPSRCVASSNGIPLTLEERRSDEHIGYFNWTGNLRPSESEWTWYICQLPAGTHRIKFSGAAGHLNPRLAVWAWADYELKPVTQITAVHATDPALPPYRDRLERRGICVMPPRVLRP